MINNEKFFKYLIDNKINYFCGVPDSTLKDFCAFITDNLNSNQNIITPNEGNAIALAAGYHLATDLIAVVYMQNSGLGNAVNPITSLVDREIYSIPMILLIGWRGKPGIKDEPQHVKMGKITCELLNILAIPYSILPKDNEGAEKNIQLAKKYCLTQSSPYAIIIEPNTFEPYKLKKNESQKYILTREEAIAIICNGLSGNEIIVSTTGKASRELYEYRDRMKQKHQKDFLTVGSMGHASHIALGIALSRSERSVYCLDGDGAVIMHLGALASIGDRSLANFKHIILNNGAHESVGGQPTVGFRVDFQKIALACGYKYAAIAEDTYQLKEKMNEFIKSDGPALLEVKLNKTSRKDLGRPKTTPLENKYEFVKFIRK